VKYSYK